MSKQPDENCLIILVRLLRLTIIKPFLLVTLILTITLPIKSFAVSPALTLTAYSGKYEISNYTIQAGSTCTITFKTNNSGFTGQKLLTISGYGNTSVSIGEIAYTFNNSRCKKPLDTSGTTQIDLDFSDKSETTLEVILYKAMNQTAINYAVPGALTTIYTTINPSAPSKLVVTQDITAPRANGDFFTTQPKVAICDRFGNIRTDSTNEIIVGKNDSGSWNLIGNNKIKAVGGVATFSGLGAANAPSVSNVQLIFASETLTSTLSNTVTLPAKKLIVSFKDYNGAILKTENIDYGTDVTAPLAPGKYGYTFTGWDKPLSRITEDIIVAPKYTITRYALKVNGGSGSGSFDASSVVKAIAEIPNDKYFAGWRDEETKSIVSYYPIYYFTLANSRTLTATFSDNPVPPRPAVSLDNNAVQINVNDDYGKIYFTSTVLVPSNKYRLIECGVAMSTTESSTPIVENQSTLLRSQAQNSAGQFNSIYKVTYGHTLYVRTYVTYEDILNKITRTDYSANTVKVTMSKQQ